MLEILILQGFRAYPVILTEGSNWGFCISWLAADKAATTSAGIADSA
jgi:hypothetical protein